MEREVGTTPSMVVLKVQFEPADHYLNVAYTINKLWCFGFFVRQQKSATRLPCGLQNFQDYFDICGFWCIWKKTIVSVGTFIHTALLLLLYSKLFLAPLWSSCLSATAMGIRSALWCILIICSNQLSIKKYIYLIINTKARYITCKAF